MGTQSARASTVWHAVPRDHDVVMMRRLDLATQWWVRRTGRTVHLAHDTWLQGLVGDHLDSRRPRSRIR
jgi:hypothetical protein